MTVKRIPIFLDESGRRNPSLDTIAVVATDGDERTLAIEVDPSSLDQECRDGARQLEAVRIYVYSTSGSFESSSVDIVPTPGGANRTCGDSLDIGWGVSNPALCRDRQ